MTQRQGVYYPVLAPFDGSYQVDHAVLARLLEFGIERGVDGIFALGSAGQGPVIEPNERKDALETIVEVVDDHVPVIAHVGTADTRTTVELAEHAATLGVEMLAALPPYYYSHSSSEISAHFEQVADAVDLELLIYINSRFTGIDLAPADIERLSREIPAIRGIKASFTDVDTVIEYVDRTPADFTVFTGNVSHLFPAVYHGVAGSIHPPTSPFPELAVDYWDALQNRDLDAALSGQQALRTVSKIVSRFAAQYGRGIYGTLFALRGIDIERYPKWETEPIPDEVDDKLSSAFAEANLESYLSQ